MKKILTLSILAVVLTIGAFVSFGFTSKEDETIEKTAYIRIHIRANSNNSVDQEVKYKVKSAVVDYLTPIIAECETLADAHAEIARNLKSIDAVATNCLAENGFSYTAKSRLNDEYFPTRAYADVVLDEGVYDALIIDLGSGTGNNWWCVVYPPLCFIGAENTGSNTITYKSKIVELINKYCK